MDGATSMSGSRSLSQTMSYTPATSTPVTGAAPLRLAIGIATRGRPGILAETLRDIGAQSDAPDRVVICAPGANDVGRAAEMLPGRVEVMHTASGLPLQRNAILDRVDDCDVLLFLDDDFLMSAGYVAATRAAFAAHPELVVTTGDLIDDGSRGPGISVEAARAMIAADAPRGDSELEPAPHGYGCNMAVRMGVARAQGERFDERLPLYAWSEDIDFSHRMARHGGLAKLHRARGVHLGTKEGRSSGHRLGYSQVANPIYLCGKGSYSFGRAFRSVGRNLVANAARSLRPEAYVDRRGRLRGNGLAFIDLLRGRLAPERILEL